MILHHGTWFGMLLPFQPEEPAGKVLQGASAPVPRKTVNPEAYFWL